MTQTSNTAALAYLQTRPMTPFASFMLQFVVLCVVWSERRRTRIALDKLEPHQLRDIGLTKEAARQEAKRPFWME